MVVPLEVMPQEILMFFRTQYIETKLHIQTIHKDYRLFGLVASRYRSDLGLTEQMLSWLTCLTKHLLRMLFSISVSHFDKITDSKLEVAIYVQSLPAQNASAALQV